MRHQPSEELSSAPERLRPLARLMLAGAAVISVTAALVATGAVARDAAAPSSPAQVMKRS